MNNKIKGVAAIVGGVAILAIALVFVYAGQIQKQAGIQQSQTYAAFREGSNDVFSSQKASEGGVATAETGIIQRAPLCKPVKLTLRFDFNYDCREDYKDINVMLTGCPPVLCDLNGSGVVTKYDAAMLAQALLAKYDINNDGKFNDADVQAIRDFLLGKVGDCPVELCDVSRDGSVNSFDVAILRQILVTKYDINNDGLFNDADPQAILNFAARLGGECPLWKCDLSGDRTVSAYDASLLAQILQSFPQ